MANFINYTGRDFDTIRASLITYLETQFPDTASNFYNSGVGTAWMNMVAYIADNLSYYTDVTVNEMFLGTAQERENVIAICALVGYKLSPPTSASVTVTFTIPAVNASNIRVASGTQFRTATNLVFELTEDVIITSGDLTSTGNCVQGQTYTETFTSDGSTNQTFTLSRSGVADGSIAATVNGSTWTEVDSIIYGDSDSTIYAITNDADDNATIAFGDGSSGVIPVTSAAIAITYRVGGGVSSNIPIGVLNVSTPGVRVGIAPEETVAVNAYNWDHGSGGADRESIESAKYWAPRYVQANGRAVTKQDFETLTVAFSDPSYGSPSHASAYLKQEIFELNTVIVRLWSLDGSGIPTGAGTSLIGAIQTYFDNNGEGAVRLICVDTEVEAGINNYITVDVSVVAESGFIESTVLSDVEDAIDTLLASTSVLPGQDFRLSLIYNAIQAVDGVESAVINDLKSSLIYSEDITTALGILKQYAYTVENDALNEGNVIEGSVSITDGDQIITDDGNGNLIGDVDAIGTNTISYLTGVMNFTFDVAPDNGDVIAITYKAIIQYQRGDTIETSDGTARVRGTIDYAPVVPGTFAISDGTQVVNDDGSGNLTGDVASGGSNTIVYDSGAFDVTFYSSPSVGSTLSAVYKQYLDNASEDVPVDDGYLAVKETITIRG